MNIAILIGIIFIGACFSMFYLLQSADKFFKEAKELELMIRSNQPKEKVLEKLYALKKKSFHRETGNRLRELALMAEIKYNIQILK